MSPPVLVSPDFVVPERFDPPGSRFILRVLRPEHLSIDYPAVMASASRLRSVFARADDWPDNAMTLEEDLIDLRRHSREWELRLAFAYTVLSPSEESCLGCMYINPATKKGFDAEIIYWAATLQTPPSASAEAKAVADNEALALGVELGVVIRAWIAAAWPFTQPCFPGRDQSWDEMDALPWRGDMVPRIAADAQTVVQYDARACGLALGTGVPLSSSAVLPDTAPRAPFGAHLASELEANGFALGRAAATGAEVSALLQTARAVVESTALTPGGYKIWTPAEALPLEFRRWAETQGAALVRAAYPTALAPRLLGGALLLKEAGRHQPTPFHQDRAYAAAKGKLRRPGCHVAVWLALTRADGDSGCLRFAPSLGFDLLPHCTVSEEEAALRSSGFETFLQDSSAAEAAAQDCVVEAGDAIVIGDEVVHAARATSPGRAPRQVFSPLYELYPDEPEHN